ncbi:MAG: EVE domain-containing protein [Ignavibacteriaceae bacterium]
MNSQKYWVAVVSKDHTIRGVSGGFMQVCHGKQAPLKRMKQNDWIIFIISKMLNDENK